VSDAGVELVTVAGHPATLVHIDTEEWMVSLTLSDRLGVQIIFSYTPDRATVVEGLRHVKLLDQREWDKLMEAHPR
jgi:hypothetical protein